MRRVLPMLLALLLLACVPTPEVDAVKLKNQDAMLELAHGEDTVTVQGEDGVKEAATVDYRGMYGIPEHLTAAFDGLTDKVRITIDADVNVPNAPMPIVRATPADFSQEQVYDLWHRLVGDRSMLISDDRETKETIKAQIERCMEILNGPEKNDYEPGEIEQMLEDLKARFNDAPDGEPPKEADGTLILGEMRDGRGNVVAHRTELQAYEPGYGIQFNVQNNYDLKETIRTSDGAICVMKNASFVYEIGACTGVYTVDFTKSCFVLRPGDAIPDVAKEHIRTTPAEIQARADGMLEKMGLTGQFQVSEIRLYTGVDPWTREPNGCFVYYVTCSRLVNGVPVCIDGTYLNLYVPEDMMAPAWNYESFAMEFDDSDWVRVHWSAPIETQEVVEPFCRLQPFSEIQRVTELRLSMLLERKMQDAHYTACTATVRRIDLGLWRIREKNTIESGLLVPVYCFYMDLVYERESDGKTTQVKATDALIVNAVDGTVIDPWNGY